MLSLQPTDNQMFRIDGRNEVGDAVRVAKIARKVEEQGEWDRAANLRANFVDELISLIPDDDVIELDYNHLPTRVAMELLRDSAADHIFIGDKETATSLLELLLDIDPEDHFDATPDLAICYVALGDTDCLDATIIDLNPKGMVHALCSLCLALLRGSKPSAEQINALRRFAPLVGYFLAEQPREATSDKEEDAFYLWQMCKTLFDTEIYNRIKTLLQ